MDVLIHAGVGHKDNPPGRGSGRYAWGTGKRPNQRSGIKGYIAKKKQEKAKEEARKAAELKAKHEADRERVLREGSATEVLQYIDEIPYERMKQITDRIKWKKELEGYAAKETTGAFERIDKVMNKVGKIANWAESSYNMVNNINKFIQLMDGKPGKIDNTKKNMQEKKSDNKKDKK